MLLCYNCLWRSFWPITSLSVREPLPLRHGVSRYGSAQSQSATNSNARLGFYQRNNVKLVSPLYRWRCLSTVSLLGACSDTLRMRQHSTLSLSFLHIIFITLVYINRCNDVSIIMNLSNCCKPTNYMLTTYKTAIFDKIILAVRTVSVVYMFAYRS